MIKQALKLALERATAERVDAEMTLNEALRHPEIFTDENGRGLGKTGSGGENGAIRRMKLRMKLRHELDDARDRERQTTRAYNEASITQNLPQISDKENGTC